MKEKKQYRHLVSTISGLLLIAILTVAFGVVWHQCYAKAIIAPFYERGNWVVVMIYAVLTMLVFQIFGCIRYGYLKQFDLICYQLIGIVMINTITYFQISVIGRHFMSLPPMLLLTLVDIVAVVFWTPFVSSIYFRLYPPHRLALVYGSQHAAELVSKMSLRVDKYMVCESISCALGLPRIAEALAGFDGVILCEIPAELRNDLLKFCCSRRLRAYVVPKISDILMRGGDELRLFDTPLILVRNEGLSVSQRFWKRSFDLLISSLLLLLLSPVMLLCALAVHLEDGGPVFYRQKRLTLNGKIFQVLKFRSMIPDAEADGKAVLAEEHDARITKVGRFLRRFRLDELPQLLNILRGDMSLVGPRPERPELAMEYEAKHPEFSYRLQVKAGLTGYAQVFGTYDTEPMDKLKMDLMYIEQYSLHLDIQILLMTIKTALFPPKTNAANGLNTKNISEKEEKK